MANLKDLETGKEMHLPPSPGISDTERKVLSSKTIKSMEKERIKDVKSKIYTKKRID